MSVRRLRAAIGGAVAAHHVRRGMTEQVLHVELAGVVFDRLGCEGVPKAMRMDLVDAGPPAQSAQHLLDAVRSESGR